MKIDLIQVPYHLGRFKKGLGLGPVKLMEIGIDSALKEKGHEVRLDSIEIDCHFRHEIISIFDVNLAVSKTIRKSLRDGFFPIVLSGDCNSCLGVLAGLSPMKPGIIWFDEHGDFNTPETTRSGYFDGMALAAATGLCWKTLVQKVLRCPTVPPDLVWLVGVRNLERDEFDLIKRSRVMITGSDAFDRHQIPGSLEKNAESLAHLVNKVYLHLDLDVIDPTEAPVNRYQTTMGLSVEALEKGIEFIIKNFQVAAFTLAAYDPDCDPQKKTPKIVINLLSRFVEILEINRK